jgi:hypothetical protein
MYVVRSDWLVESERAFSSIVSPPSEHGRPGSDMVVSILGTNEVIKALAQQLAWLSAVFRVAKSDQLTLSHVEFMCIRQGEFELRPFELEEIGTKQSACWHPLVKGSLVASDFPIPDRQGEIGLELPFQGMVQLARVSLLTMCGGRVALCGFSTLIYPTAQSSDTFQYGSSSCVQWHLVANEDLHSELNSTEIVAGVQSQWLNNENEEFLVQARTFVGYCKAAYIHLGTE